MDDLKNAYVNARTSSGKRKAAPKGRPKCIGSAPVIQ
jgi:hypothetical protein